MAEKMGGKSSGRKDSDDINIMTQGSPRSYASFGQSGESAGMMPRVGPGTAAGRVKGMVGTEGMNKKGSM
jgi:hypothetical protein